MEEQTYTFETPEGVVLARGLNKAGVGHEILTQSFRKYEIQATLNGEGFKLSAHGLRVVFPGLGLVQSRKADEADATREILETFARKAWSNSGFVIKPEAKYLADPAV